MDDIIEVSFGDPEEEMIPMDEWDGSCWKTLFDWFAENFGEDNAWDYLAGFIKQTLMKEV